MFDAKKEGQDAGEFRTSRPRGGSIVLRIRWVKRCGAELPELVPPGAKLFDAENSNRRAHRVGS